MNPATNLAVGTLVGPYRITGELGGGGMGMVYRAMHAMLDRPAAIKVLRPELGTYAMASDRFLTEARVTTAIRHPGIVEVYDYGHTDAGNAFIAMELLEGKTLAARLAERGPMTVFEAMTIARRIAAPLAAAHERGVVHRDLKPENVFLVRDREGSPIEQVKLLDFGIAKLESTATGYKTTIGFILGTPAYMSPEQCLGTSDCDHRADLYALGCILFEMLSGRSPYSSVPTADLLAAHIQRPIPELGRLVNVPHEIERLVTRLLAKSPDDRPRTAIEVIEEIDRWFAKYTVVTPRRSSLRMAIVTASGIALALTAIGAWYRWWRAGARHGVDAAALDISTQATTVERIDAGTPYVDTGAPTVPVVPHDAAIDVVELDAPIDARVGRVTSVERPAGSRQIPIVPPTKSEDVIIDLGNGSSGGVDTTVKDVVLDR